MDGGGAGGNPLSNVLPLATRKMGWKSSYERSKRGLRPKADGRGDCGLAASGSLV